MFVILLIKTLVSGFRYSTFDYCEYDLDSFWPLFKFTSISNHQSKRGYTENIFLIFVNPQNILISDMHVLFQ